MKVLVNLIAIKSGGGVQVALDFIENIKSIGNDIRWAVIVSEGSGLENIKVERNIEKIAVVKKSITHRLYFEIYGNKTLLKEFDPDVIYTLFGPPMLNNWGCKIVGGCAYSNLFYPEVDFWQGLGISTRIKKYFIDKYRLFSVARNDKIIFETSALAERAVSIRNFKEKSVEYVLPAVSKLVVSSCSSDNLSKPYDQLIPSGFNVVLISTFREHKNIDIYPLILKELEDVYGVKDINFVVTFPDSDKFKKIEKHCEGLNVKDRLINIGPVSPDECNVVYDLCDAVILPSSLESFSNTVIEAWSMGKPLLITDRDWARSACGEGAIYFPFRNHEKIAELLVSLKNDNNLYQKKVEDGYCQLDKYPNSIERFEKILNILLEVVECYEESSA